MWKTSSSTPRNHGFMGFYQKNLSTFSYKLIHNESTEKTTNPQEEFTRKTIPQF